MAIGNIESFNSTPLTASAQIKASDGVLRGVFVSSGTALTLKFWDSLTASGKVIVETTVAMTPTAPVFISIPATFSTGCFVTAAGTGSFTVFWI